MVKNYVTMGMPAIVHIVDKGTNNKDVEEALAYFDHIDSVFSTYKKTSEISQINAGKLKSKNASEEVQHVLALCEETKKETNGFFDIEKNGIIDPLGIVKGYAIHEAAAMLRKKGYENFSVEIAGDAEVAGAPENNELWRIGIQNPFNTKEIVKMLSVTDKGVATSGNYMRGKHMYNPIEKQVADEIASITVIGSNVYEADRFATAAFAMGEKGIEFIENLPNLEGYMIQKDKIAIYTSGFEKFVLQ